MRTGQSNMFGLTPGFVMGEDMFDEEARSKPRVAHVVGEPLDDLSVRELDERIIFLRAEIERLEIAKGAKLTAAAHAGLIFKS